MPKLPPDFVKAPVFDQPHRATTPSVAPPPLNDGKRELILRVPEPLYRLLETAAAAEGLTPNKLVERILADWGTPTPVRSEPRRAAEPIVEEPARRRAESAGLVAQVIELFGAKLRRLPLLRRFAVFVEMSPSSGA